MMSPYDLLVTDRMFRSLRHELSLLCGWTKKKLSQLQQWQKQENSEISTQRGNKIINL